MAGRPCIPIDLDTVIYYKTLGYTQKESADMLGIPYRTFKNFLKRSNLRKCDLITEISGKETY